MKFWFVVCAGSLLQASLGAATYYVSITGSDSNAGSQTQPWRTIQKAANTVSPGDTVVVQPGDYGELVNLARDAAPGQPITFRSNGAETGGFNCRKSDYVIQGFSLNGTNASMTSASALVYVYAEASRLKILDNYFHDAPSQQKYAIWLGQASTSNPVYSSSYNVVSNNSFVRIDYINVACSGVSNRFVKNVFKDSNGQADVFRLWGHGHVASENLVTNLSMIAENHTDFFQVFGPNPARTTNDYNMCRDIVLERNTVVNSRIQICQLETFENPAGYMTNLVFRNNIFANLPYAANVDMDGTKWFNNVFYRVNYANGGHVFAFGGPKGSAYGTEIKNNVFAECGNTQNWVGWYPTVGQFGITNFDLAADYNFVYGANFEPKQAWPAYPNGWGAQGQDTHGINGGNPGFFSPGTLDFRIGASSPLVNAGTVLSSFSNDLLGKPRNDGRWDIGVYEYQITGGTPPSPPSNIRAIEMN